MPGGPSSTLDAASSPAQEPKNLRQILLSVSVSLLQNGTENRAPGSQQREEDNRYQDFVTCQASPECYLGRSSINSPCCHRR